MENKICKNCNQIKLPSEFYKGSPICKPCQIIRQRVWAQNNPDKVKQHKRKYLSNPDNVLRDKQSKHNHFVKNRELYRQKSKAWTKNNRHYRNNYVKLLKLKNPNYRFSEILRSRTRAALKAQKCKKSSSTQQLLGCSYVNLRYHLEKQFKPGMNWDNYGNSGWNIDHILPCASFDLSDPEQQKKCFHYTNLQPLWATDNFKKSDKITSISD